MEISGDNRSITHFYVKAGEPVYTLIFPSQHSLRERYAMIQELCSELLIGIKVEETIEKKKIEKKKEYDELKDCPLTFDEWLEEKEKEVVPQPEPKETK